MWATATDISGGGCYLQTVSTIPVGTQLEMKVTIDRIDVNCVGEVRTSHPNIGMGIQFQMLEGENQQRLHTILEVLEAAQGDKLPLYMRVLAQIERTRECLSLVDQLIRQDPTHIWSGLPQSISSVQRNVTQMLREQRGEPAEEKAQATSS
jgi:hypothetical protein